MNFEVTNGKIYCDGREVKYCSFPLDAQKLWFDRFDPKRFRTRLGDSFQVEKIIASGPVVTIIWKDQEKTRVKIDECSDYSIYFAFCSAVCKKLFGNNSTIKREISNHLDVDWERVSDEAFDDLINYVEAPEWCYE